jgi:hypothetical protein
MKKYNIILKSYLKFSNVGIPLIFLFFIILPFCILCVFAHPSSDDFNYANDVLKFGVVQSNINFYKLCFGRYFSTFILTAFNPLVYHKIWLIKIFFLSNLLFFTYSIFFFIKTVFEDNFKSLTITTIILFDFMYFIPSTSEAFYWMAGAVTYILPCSLLFFWNALIIVGFRESFTFIKKACILFSGIMIIGSNEISMFLFVLNLLFLIITLNKIRKRDFIWFYVACGIYLFFVLVVFISPGNSTKPILYGAKQNYHLLKSVQLSFINTLNLFNQLFKNTPLILTNIIFILFINFKSKKISLIPAGYFLCLYCTIILFALFPLYYSLGNFSFYRTTNLLLLFIIFGWFVLQLIFLTHYNINIQTNKSTKLIISLMVFSLILISMRQKNNITIAYADLIKGRAFKYNLTLNERYKLINNSVEGAFLSVDSIPIIPKTIYITDITSDSTYWFTKCYSGYFKRTIILKSTNGPK